MYTLALHCSYLMKKFISNFYFLQISGLITNTGHSVIFTAGNDTVANYDGMQTPVNISGGPLSYRYRFHEIHMHYGLNDQFGSEHSVEGYTFPAEVRYIYPCLSTYAVFATRVTLNFRCRVRPKFSMGHFDTCLGSRPPMDSISVLLPVNRFPSLTIQLCLFRLPPPVFLLGNGMPRSVGGGGSFSTFLASFQCHPTVLPSIVAHCATGCKLVSPPAQIFTQINERKCI